MRERGLGVCVFGVCVFGVCMSTGAVCARSPLQALRGPEAWPYIQQVNWPLTEP